MLLAAGAGTRLGKGPKALLPYRGVTLVEHLAGVLLAGGCTDVIVVLGSEAETVRAGTLLPGCRTVVNPRWATGLGSSLQCGVATAAPLENVLVALVDQPGVNAELIRRLRKQHQDGRITAAGYSDASGRLRRGHPVLFDADLAREAAAAASADTGARSYLRAHSFLLDTIDCSDLGTGQDIDTPADLPLLDQSSR
ncbi:nucleotidyltransferase family protein [Paenarthrobacter sp. Z7-10]|nr:nucleotidyltransferase family protein [Paenarthrobacter sp. Z7-10]